MNNTITKWEYSRLIVRGGEDIDGTMLVHGEQGWELVAAHESLPNGSNTILYFKRPIPIQTKNND